MPEFQNPEQKILHYKKVIYPLETLVKIVNVTIRSKIAITINVKGSMISGFLVALKEFDEYTSNTIMESIEQTSNEETFRSMGDIIREMQKEYTNEELQDLVNSYVCIKNPTFHGINDQPVSAFWIGKLESVDGFMIGIIQGNIPNK
jgi:hypothetical protein